MGCYNPMGSASTHTSLRGSKGHLEQKAKMQETSLVKNVPFTNIGPTVMSGRVVDVDVNPNNPTEFYVAYASGGLWYSNITGLVLPQ